MQSDNAANTKQNVDVAIIGAGTAGLGAYRAAKAQTDNVILIEGGPYGTTCARVGCMPSKLLIAAAEAAHSIEKAPVFGVSAGPVKVDGRAVMQRVRSERDRFTGFVVESVEGIPAEDRLRGFAEFLDDHRLKVSLESGGEIELNAERIVIATGSRPVYPASFQALDDRLLINDSVFELETLPESVAIFGPGVIGLELGQSLSRLGVNVRVFGIGGGLGATRDPEIREYARQAFNEEFYLDPDAKVKGMERVEGDGRTQVEIAYTHQEKGEVIERFDYVLAATGRKPNVDNLGLDKTSLMLDDRGVPVFDRYTLQTQLKDAGSSSHIFIAGDANNDIPLLHEAADEGRIAGQNAGGFPRVLAGRRRAPIAVVFTDPQIAAVGLTLDQVKERCHTCYATGKVSFEDQGRSRVMAKNKGMLKVYGEQGSGLFLGAEMFGPAAEHIAHLLSWAVQKRMTVSEMLDMPFYHPVIEEGVRTALRDLNHNLHIGPDVIERCLDCGPGA
ncbi:dihydrolipoyl dehydrogenase [Alkalimarinus sediminis]|uniref:Dihydrolipoyl dehydrogenase n=1 Tax=Alkalimarinus sediminis TaxID=1632866 RepID=A0A9E8HW02_9ALTE|nr:dihydrolipoyl dehydrogenase [Alkalimarinus sediminis]UZW76874.1 dihydrolipoyl dehydrogenase [Alkalimarinus sediminis]